MNPAVMGGIAALLIGASAAGAQTSLAEGRRSPSAEQVRAAYPAQARQEGVSGMAWIGCVITAEGVLADCEVVDERPVGRPLGFGDAALTLAPHYAFKPAIKDGQAAPSRVNLPVQFDIETVNRPPSP